eukprot:CAMPEP_0118679142 /NCGR_PEP_ID=MMETSP0800-20121206/3627_1 /TAXON_ID=210618 ORGANISM="Striatella unipunctata, Strain CCMP2910" /NCGR_SAMPLE_ID=MMETSP0800 /ASSEMBLY_ACC=CAM_ASM_000638 /LENGTH=226 /DNA_ID=CAMNT_0006575111 /DNA_START=170 /DNA_END=850 /DNA_ORIENTATION=+
MLETLIRILPTPGDGAIGALDWTPMERKRLAKESAKFACAKCGLAASLLPKICKIASGTTSTGGGNLMFAKEIEELKRMQMMNEAGNNKKQEQPATEEETDAKEQEEEPELVAEEEQEEKKETPALTTTTTTTTTRQTTTTMPVEEDTEEPIPEIPRAAAVDETETQQQVVPQNNGAVLFGPSWLTDPMIHTIIVIFTVICALLFRKWMQLNEELAMLMEQAEMQK